MQVVRFTTLEPLAPLAAQWDRLSRGVPFRSWAWLSAWWRHYGNAQTEPTAGAELCVLGVIDRSGELVGIAPWYVEHSVARGRVLRWLGSGEVCSDHLSLLCQPQHEAGVAESLADWLTASQRRQPGHPAGARCDGWDLLELTAVDADDTPVRRLTAALETHHCTVYRRPGLNCWQLDLPGTWEQYLAMLSKNHRKQVRRVCERLLMPGRVVLHTVRDEDDLPRGEAILIELHRQRRASLGQPACFASPRFAAFHHEVMRSLLRAGRLGLHWIEWKGVAVAAEYQILGNNVVYAYQAGIAPGALEYSPGTLAHAATIRKAIEEGRQSFDFLCGDEPYKAHWRAKPRACLEIHVVPPRAAARLRHGMWRSGRGVGHWLKRGWEQLTRRAPRLTNTSYGAPSPSNDERSSHEREVLV